MTTRSRNPGPRHRARLALMKVDEEPLRAGAAHAQPDAQQAEAPAPHPLATMHAAVGNQAVQRLLAGNAQRSLSPKTILQLQRMIGNQAVQRMTTAPTAPLLQRQDQSQSFSIKHDVELIPQMQTMSCWAAAGAMVVSYRDGVSLTDLNFAQSGGTTSTYTGNTGLQPNNTAALTALGLTVEAPRGYTVASLRAMLETSGPLWFATNPTSPHARVITGMDSDGTLAGTTLHINDPWPVGNGAKYTRSFATIFQSMEGLARNEASTQGAYYIAHG